MHHLGRASGELDRQVLGRGRDQVEPQQDLLPDDRRARRAALDERLQPIVIFGFDPPRPTSIFSRNH